MFSNCCRPNRLNNCCNNDLLELDNCCNIIRRNRSFCDCQMQHQQKQQQPQRLPDFSVPRAKNTNTSSKIKKRKGSIETPASARRSTLPRSSIGNGNGHSIGYTDQLIDRSIDRTLDRSIDRTLDRSIDRTLDHSIDRTRDRSLDRSVDRTIDRTGESQRNDCSCPCPPCPCPCPCPPCGCPCPPCCGGSNGKRGTAGNVNNNTKNLKNKQNYQQYQDMFSGGNKKRMEVINEEQEERYGGNDDEDCYFDSEHSKKIQESCADFLSIVHDTVLETVQKSVETIMRDYFQHTMEKVECLCTQQMRNECLLSKMYLDIMDKISQQNDKSLRQFKCLCQLIAENRNNDGSGNAKSPTTRIDKPGCDDTCPCDVDLDCKDCNCAGGSGNGNCNGNGNIRRRNSNNNGNGGSGYRRNSDNQRGNNNNNNNNSDTELYRKQENGTRNSSRHKEGSNISLTEEIREIRHLSNDYGSGRKTSDTKRYNVKSGPSVPDLQSTRSRSSFSKSN